MCDDSYFKCPGFYCLPWRYVCNTQWECPGGTDEMNCHITSYQMSCPGMFKCKDSSVCIARASVCDAILDCHLNDDEYICPKVKDLQICPSNCSCYISHLNEAQNVN